MVYSLHRSTAFSFVEVVEGTLPKDYVKLTLDGSPLPFELVPKRLRLKADRPMPNIWRWGGPPWVCSPRARQMFDQLVPGSIEWVPMLIDGPPAMKLESEYYFMNVLVRDQLINYERSRLRRKRAPSRDGRFFTSTESPPGGRGIVFRPHPKFHIWHEISFTVGDEYYQFATEDVLLSDELWRELNAAFPNEIDPDELSADKLNISGAAS